MKFNAKLLVVAFIFAMIFAVGSVSAVENGTASSSDLTQVPHEQVVSVPDSTVQEVETIDLETSGSNEKAQTNKITSGSDNLKSTDSNKESLRKVKMGTPLLKASNNVDVLGVPPKGNTFADLREAIGQTPVGEVVDLQGRTIYGYGGNLEPNKNITIANGVLNGNSYKAKYSFTNCKLENLTVKNFYTEGGTGINNAKLNNVVFDNCTSDTSCTFAVRSSTLEKVNFTNCKCLMPEDPAKKIYEDAVMIVTYNSRFNNCYFVNCSSNRHSGAICVAGKVGNTANITNCVFDNCTSGIGGAIYLHGTGLSETRHSNVINCTFTNCVASHRGGAIGSSQNYLNVENCRFINNTAKQGAAFMVGGINKYALDGDNTQGHYNTMKNCYFHNNTGTEEGGAVHITGNNNSAIGCHFDDNYAHNGNGAAIYVKGLNAKVYNSEFYHHDCQKGTVYIEGDHANVTSSKFENNTASMGGAGVYVLGNYSVLDDNIFANNNATIHGGAIHSEGNYALIHNSLFQKNNAIPNIHNKDQGLGGAIYIRGDDNEISLCDFEGNTARNGSAIYNKGKRLHLNDDEFFNNQAWSYLLFTTAQPKLSYYNESESVEVEATHVGGDNIINAIHNAGLVTDIFFHNVTYLHSTGPKNSGSQIHPVPGVEKSEGGKLIYQDDREDLQSIELVVSNYKTGEETLRIVKTTNLMGAISHNLTGYLPGVYKVVATHHDSANYTEITNTTFFEILPQVDVSVTKTSDKDVYIRGEDATFTIKVNSIGSNATNVKVKDILPKSLKYVSDSATKGTYDPVNNVWNIGFMPHGASETLKLIVKTTQIGTFNNIVNVTCAERDWDLSNNVDNKTIHVDLYYTKEANATDVSAGENLEYYLTVFNKGNTDYTEEIQIRDTLPQGIKYLGKYELEGADLVRYVNYGDQQIWYITNIRAGTNARITVKCQALEDGVWENTMNVWDLPPVKETVEVTHNADLQIIKSVSVPKVSKGDIINWTIVVINHGPSVASDVVVKDLLPEGLEIYGVAIPDYPTRFDRDTGTWTIGTLEVEKPIKLIIPTRVTISARSITNYANVTSTTPDPDLSNNEDNESVEFYPDMSVVKTVSKRITSHGAVVSWTIKVTNNGPHDATGVYVIDNLPAGLKYISSVAAVGTYNPGSGRWTIGDLSEGRTVTLTINTEVTAYEGYISNNATVYAPNDGDPSNNYDEDFTEVITKADVGVVKLVSDQISHYGDEITWTVRVTNYGPSMAENVVLIDYLPIDDLVQTRQPYVSKGQISHQGITGRWDIGNMAVGETQYIEIYTKVLKINKDIINVVTVTSDTEDPNPSNNRAENATYVPPECDVEVIKRVSNSTPNKYDIVEWTITIFNAGPEVAEHVVVTDVLPEGLEFVSNEIPDIGMYHKELNKWDVGNLEVGVRHSLKISTRVVDTELITNEVNITTSTYDVDLENNYDNESIMVPALADLQVTKTVSNKNPKFGDLIDWTIVVTNNGPDTARNVVVNDLLPAGLIYLKHKSNPAGLVYDSTLGIWQIGTLLSSKSVSLVITTKVNITNAAITNVAVVTSTTPDDNPDNNKDNDTANVNPEADVKVIKTVSNPTPKTGDVITWTITVINLGPDAAENVAVEDILPGGLKLLSAKGTKGKFLNKIWTVGTLNNRQSETLILTTKVTATGGTIRNVAIATSTTYDPNKSNNRDDDVTKPKSKPAADLEIIKLANVKKAKVGDKIIWTITVINYGPDAAKNVRVKDVLTDNVEYISSRATKGSFDPFYGVWSIGDMEVGDEAVLKIVCKALTAGTVVNTAEVESDTPDPNPDNNKDTAIVIVTENPTPDTPGKTPSPNTPAMHATGNPIAMVLLALLALVGAGLRRKD